jgi:hypothetical protein
MALNRQGLLTASAVALAILAALLLSDPASAGKGKTLGAARPAEPTCPEDCLVEARVTSFQTRIGRKKAPFRAPRSGRIVAWSVKLGEPRKRDTAAFTRSFGASRGRISILKPIRTKRGKRQFRLLRQSPSVRLGPFFGEVTTFGLTRPLRINKGQIVALTVPTWAPVFAVGQTRSTSWRASRVSSRGGCFTRGGGSNVDAGAAHERPGTNRPYRCLYRGTRMLYSARFIPG